MTSAGRVMPLPKGTYSGSTTYHVLDVVEYNGSSYIAKQTTTGNAPTNTTYWQLLVTPTNAAGVNYNNSGSGLPSTTVQGAIDDLNSLGVQILDQTVSSLGDVIVNRQGILTITTAALQPESGISVYGYMSLGSGSQKVIIATRFGNNDTWVNAAGDGYTFNGWTKISPQSGTLKYLGQKSFSFTYDGNTTAQSAWRTIYNNLLTYISAKSNNYRFKISMLSLDSSAYSLGGAVPISASLYNKNFNLPIEFIGDGAGYAQYMTHGRIDATTVLQKFDFSNLTNSSVGSVTPGSGAQSRLDIDEYEIV